MCRTYLRPNQRKEAKIVKQMISNHLEGRLIYPILSLADYKVNMYDIQTYLKSLQCQNIIGNWSIIPNEDVSELELRFQTTFISFDTMTVKLKS